MRIYYIGKFGPYSTENFFTQALLNKGVLVTTVDISNGISAPDLVKDTWDYDYVMFNKIKDCEGLVAALNHLRPPTICWVPDKYPWIGRDWNEPQFRADVVLTTGSGDYPVLRQGIHRPHKKIVDHKKEYDVLFVGGLHSQPRIELHEFLEKTYENYKQVGEYEEVRGIDLNHLVGKSKVIIGDSVPEDNYWSNRVYEMSGRGGFLIHPYVKGMEEEWEDGKSIVFFKYGHYRELKEKIDYYLEREGERDKIRTTAFNRCPTYEDRVEEFLCYLKKK